MAHLFRRLTLVSQDNVSETNPRGCEYRSLFHCLAEKQLCFMNWFPVAWVWIISCLGKVWMSLWENSRHSFSVRTRCWLLVQVQEKITLEETTVLLFHNGCTRFHSCKKRMNISVPPHVVQTRLSKLYVLRGLCCYLVLF